MTGNQWERVIDLSRYYPEFLREIREFGQLAKAEDGEIGRFYENSDKLWQDGFIQTATVQGIKRWESLLGIKPYPADSLPERRAAVLMKWNQQLPYTLPRLEQRLETAVGSGAYELSVKYGQYELEQQLIDQSSRVMQELREMTRQMIPANLRYIFAGKFPVEVKAEVETEAGLEAVAEYYARNNREFLWLDESWILDGKQRLNGYKVADEMDLYPARMSVCGGYEVLAGIGAGTGTAAQSRVCLEMENGCRAVGEARAESGSGSLLGAVSDVEMALDGGSRLTVEKDLWYLDGSEMLSGARILDALVLEYEL